MTVGAVTMACLLLVSGQVGDDVYKTSKHKHIIPIDLQPARKQEIRELLLFVSTDQGKNWKQVTSVTPDKDHFLYFAPNDGEYWFRVAAVKTNGKADPENIYHVKAEETLKMLIDSVKPLLRLTPQREANDLVVSWDAQDMHLDPRTLKIEYKVADSSPPVWLSLPATFSPNGQARARLNTPGPVEIRAEVRDIVGNASLAQAEVPSASGLAAAGFTQNVNTQANNSLPPAPPPTLPTPPPSAPPTSQFPPPPAPGSEKTTFAGSSPVNNVAAGQDNKFVVATSTDQGSPTSPMPTAGGRKLPRVQFVSDNEVNVEYKLEKVGPAGVGRIEVWLTEDGGLSWNLYAVDDQPTAPTSGVYQRSLPLPRDREGLLPREGLYGLSLVVKSKAGRGRAAPRAGDLPEMLVEVDRTAPTAHLFAPELDPERKDAVVLKWKANDKNLTDTPITLEWSDTPKGPWRSIATNLPNSGRYSWPLSPDTPDKVYLQLRVRDRAGNLGEAVTSQAQVIDLSEPTGQLITIAPARRE